MIEKENITRAANEGLRQMGRPELFVVEVKVGPGGDIEVFIDSDGRVTVDDCIALSRAIEGQFNRDEDDFSLTVSSAGIGQPLRVARQYKKLVGKSAEVVLNEGGKILGTLEAFYDGTDGADSNGTAGAGITLSYPEKRTVDGKKRSETVMVTKTFPLSEVKSTKEYIDFK